MSPDSNVKGDEIKKELDPGVVMQVAVTYHHRLLDLKQQKFVLLPSFNQDLKPKSILTMGCLTFPLFQLLA